MREEMREEEEDEEGRFVVKYVEPFEDVIYFVKTVTVKEVRIFGRFNSFLWVVSIGCVKYRAS